jgi:hypothetical protein
MSRFAQRVAGDLGQIADRATPSSTAFDSIQTRIAEQTDEPDMEVIMLTPEDNEVSERTWVKPGVIVAAAAAILIVVGIVAFNSSDDDDAAVAAQDPTEEALGVALDFVRARDAGDGEAVRSLVADDAELDGEIVSTADEYPAVAEFNQATGWRFTEPDCTTTVVGPPAEVTCTYVMENAWSQALGVGPFTGSSYQFVIADGQIRQVTHNLDTSEFGQAWDVFMDWLNDTYPDDVDTMIDPTDNVELPRATPEANALWEQHTTEFVSSQRDS